MEQKNANNNEKEKIILIKSHNKFMDIKSKLILKKIFEHTPKNILLKIIKYNRNMQKN